MSKAALRAFAEKILTNEELCPKILEDELSEDKTTSLCWAKVNVYPVDGRDILKRDRFRVGSPRRHLFSQLPEWYWRQQYYQNAEGLDSCSNYTVSFHKISPRYLYTLYYLSYRLRPYGIEYRYPPIAKKTPLASIIRTLELERVNVSLGRNQRPDLL